MVMVCLVVSSLLTCGSVGGGGAENKQTSIGNYTFTPADVTSAASLSFLLKIMNVKYNERQNYKLIPSA